MSQMRPLGALEASDAAEDQCIISKATNGDSIAMHALKCLPASSSSSKIHRPRPSQRGENGYGFQCHGHLHQYYRTNYRCGYMHGRRVCTKQRLESDRLRGHHDRWRSLQMAPMDQGREKRRYHRQWSRWRRQQRCEERRWQPAE